MVFEPAFFLYHLHAYDILRHFITNIFTNCITSFPRLFNVIIDYFYINHFARPILLGIIRQLETFCRPPAKAAILWSIFELSLQYSSIIPSAHHFYKLYNVYFCCICRQNNINVQHLFMYVYALNYIEAICL